MTLAERFARARRDESLAVLEGFHAIKHAVRFGADIEEIVTRDPESVASLAASLAPDVAVALAGADVLDDETFAGLAPRPSSSSVIAIARRRAADPTEVVAGTGPAPVLLLEAPRRAGNLGAAIRSAAAAGVAGVLVIRADPWLPAAIRGAAGLQFAVPVAEVDDLPPTDRPLVALHPGGEPLSAGSLPHRAVLAFGSERRGLSEDLLDRADARRSIPMREGVSSLNLGAAVAVTLYVWRLGAP